MKKQTLTKGYNPYTPSRRFMTKEDTSSITAKKPHKSLLVTIKNKAGRDNTGRISVHHRGGGAKRKYRIISSLQDFIGQKVTVKTIEYDPNRSARIMLVELENGSKKYLLAPEGIKVGDKITADEKVSIKTGNRLKLRNIPSGTEIYDIEIHPNSKGTMVKSAGSSAMLLALAEGEGKRAKYVQIKLPSGEIRLIHQDCFASIGKVSNSTHFAVKLGKAGRSRWLRRRPHVRGKAKNPVDHPHGGGEGGSPVGLKHPKTPTGKAAMGLKTRRNKRSSKFIIKRKKQK